MADREDEDQLLRSVALQNASSILAARQRAEEELLRTKDALRESQERLRAALAAAGTGTLRWDFSSDLIEWDGNLDQLFGLPAGGSTTQPFENLLAGIHADDRAAVRECFERAAREGVEFYSEFRVVRNEGAISWLAGRARVFADAAGHPSYMTGAFGEVTARKAVEEALREAAEERKTLLESERAARSAAERLSDIKDEFLATLSHELRTPLNAILGWSQVLRTASRDEMDYRRGLETIERNARVQTQLIDDLLDMSRITSGKLRLDVQALQPLSFIEAAIESIEPAADAKGIRVERVLDPTAGPISGDPGRLQQVIWNLLTNAIKFTPKDGKVQVILERVNSHVEISVADTGVGIRPELLPHLFERFRQGDASTTKKYGGLGLGLSIVKSLVELHGGTVKAHSAGEGLGMTVTVHLPVMVVHRNAGIDRQHPRADRAHAAVVAAPELRGLKVLVVDDQPDARELIKRVLEDCAAEVATAADADEALACIEAHPPDVLVTDIGMPGTDGFELLRRVRALDAARGGRIPAVALTAFARSEDRTRALRAGFMVHVSKPVDPAELIATVASVAGRIER